MLSLTGTFIFLLVVMIRVEVEGMGLRGLLNADTEWEKDVIQATKQVVERYLTGCHLVLASPSTSNALIPIIKGLLKIGKLAVFTEPCDDSKHHYGNPTDNESQEKDRVPLFWRAVWGSGKATCRALLLDHTTCGIHTAARLLSWSWLWLQPRTRVVMFGGGRNINMLFRHSALRNSLHVIYIKYGLFTSYARHGRHVIVYHRCLYCPARKADARLLFQWKLDEDLPEDTGMFSDQAEDFMGRKMDIVFMQNFPYTSFKVGQNASTTKNRIQDSLDTRMITTLARHLNFSYVLKKPADKQWGVQSVGGNWTGIVGTLQHEMADFSMDITLTPGRAKIVQFSRAFIDEALVILSSKPKPLPEYLSLVRPLEGEVWGAIFVCVMMWGSVLWILERLSHRITGRRYLSFSSSVFYGWGLLLEDHPFEPPPSPSSQIHVGWWLLVYLILSTAYRSSLISHLVVQGKSSVINSMEELTEKGEKEGWVWGVWGAALTGVYRPFFASNPSPAILKVYEEIKLVEKEEGMNRVLDGDFSYIDNYYFMKTVVSTFYTDARGYTPVHISTSHYPLFGGNAWAFRKGAPFHLRIDNAMQRLLDAGLITFWMDEVISTHVIKERQASKEKGIRPQLSLIADSDGQVVLGLNHLQGTFYTLILGHTWASLSFVCELLLKYREI